MSWTIEARSDLSQAALMVASHIPVSGITRRYRSSKLIVAMYAQDRPRGSMGRFRVQGGAFRPIGPLMVIPPETELEVKIDAEDHRRMIWLHVSRQHLADSDVDWRHDNRALGRLLDIRSPSVAALMQSMAQEITAPQVASAIRTRGLFYLLIAELVRCLHRELQPAKGGLAAWQLQRVHELTKDCRVTPAVAEIAAACGLSERHLMRCFKESTGFSIGEYVRLAKSEQLKQALHDPDLSLKEIAAAMGFASQAGFSTFARKLLGETASDYRRRLLHSYN